MKCPERNIECLNWSYLGYALPKCPYENFKPYQLIDRLIEEKRNDEKNIEHWANDL